MISCHPPENGRSIARVALFLILTICVSATADSEPADHDMALLEKYRPIIHIAPGGTAPVDFYGDYLPLSVLRDERKDGAILIEHPKRNDLVRFDGLNGVYLDYAGPPDLKGSPVAYGRVYQELTPILIKGEEVMVPFIFLKYNFAFPVSGLPAGLPWYKQWLASIAGDPVAWRELDIHGSIIVALTTLDGKGLAPVALVLGQHNHYRTYLLGRSVPAINGSGPEISFALRSNEPYPLPSGKERVCVRTVANPSGFSFVITGGGLSIFSGYDHIYGPSTGAKRIDDYTIEQLPPSDPLYTARISLGDRRRLFGMIPTYYRDGPPGMDLNSWPGLLEYGAIMRFWFVDEGDRKSAALFDRHIKGFSDANLPPVLKYNSRRFSEEFLKLFSLPKIPRDR